MLFRSPPLVCILKNNSWRIVWNFVLSFAPSSHLASATSTQKYSPAGLVSELQHLVANNSLEALSLLVFGGAFKSAGLPAVLLSISGLLRNLGVETDSL